MTPLEKLQQQHQQNYSDMPFEEFADKYRAKFYPDFTAEEFKEKVGMVQQASEPKPTESPGPEAQASMLDYILEQAKIGGAEFLRRLVPGRDILQTDFSQFGPLFVDGQPNQEAINALESAVAQGRQEDIENIIGAFGGEIQRLQPRNRLESALGTAAREVALEGPLALVGARGPVSALTEIGFSYTAAAAGAIGSDLAAEAAREAGAGATGQQIAGMIGGVAAAGGPTATRALVGPALTAGGDSFNSLMNKRGEIKESADKASDFIATSEINQVIKKATEAQPNIDDVIQSTIALQSNVPGSVIPPVAVLADNPVYRKNTEYLLKTNPEFYQKAKDSLTATKKLVDTRREQLFGKSDGTVELEIQTRLPKDYGIKLNAANKQINSIDNQIAKITSDLRPDTDFIKIGQQVDNLITAKKAAVRSKLSPQYDKVINDAETAGIALSKEAVQDVYNFVGLQQKQDIFRQFPSINSKIKSVFSPKNVPIEQVMGGEVSAREAIRTGRRTVKVFEPASIRDLDSLKREVNLQLNKVKDENTRRDLLNLKTAVQRSIDTLPESFSVPYKQLDAQYYAELGMPMNAAGVRQLDSARFQTQAGTFLTKAEQARDFINLVGDAGVPVVKDAILLNVANRVIDGDGNFNVRAFNKILEQDRNLFNVVPGMREDLINLGVSVRAMESTKARMDAEFSKYSKEQTDNFYKAFDARGVNGVVTDIINSPAKRAKYLRDIKNFTPDTAKIVRQGIRASFLERALNTPGISAVEFLNKNKNAVSDLFGKTYINDVQAIAEISDILNRIDLENMRFAVSYKDSDVLQERTGISAVQLQSILRDRISNAGTKIAIIGSKINTNQVASKRDSQLMELLLNPAALEQLRSVADAQKLKLTKPETLNKIAQLVNTTVTKGIYFGMEAAEAQVEQQLEEEQSQ